MRSLLVVLAVVGVAVAKPGYLGLGLGARNLLHAPVAYSSVAAPLAYSTYAAPLHYGVHHGVSSQYHAQDELGQYSYGYSGGPSAKSEVKTFDGVTRGGYSYVDPVGQVQSVNYVADAAHGFRVAATNLPVAPEPIPAEPLVAPVPVHDTVEVAAAKVAHHAAHVEAKAAAEAPALLYGGLAHGAIAYSNVAAAPIAYHANVAPVHYSAAIAAPLHYGVHHGVSSQYHAQDELGQYSYGYSGGPSAKSEVKTFDGVTRGGYSYVDPVGQVQSVNYVADPVHGFRVAATNLPVAPVAHGAPVLDAIPDTVEVAAAKAHHFAAHEEAKARLLVA